MSFDLPTYLERIGLSSCPKTLIGLQHLQRAQMSTIALANVEVLLGHVPDLSSPSIWDKLVVHRRGGNSMEVNGLLGSALQALSFMAKPILGRLSPASLGDDSRVQLAWVVTVEGRDWLVHAGLGSVGPFAPILESSEPQPSSGAMFRVIIDYEQGEKVLQRDAGGNWVNVYQYTDAPAMQADVGSARQAAPWPDHSLQVSSLFMSIHRPDGRLSVVNATATTEGVIGSRSWRIPTLTEFAATVRTSFMLNYSDKELALLWAATGNHHEREAA